jgi:hypothetical protein
MVRVFIGFVINLVGSSGLGLTRRRATRVPFKVIVNPNVVGQTPSAGARRSISAQARWGDRVRLPRCSRAPPRCARRSLGRPWACRSGRQESLAAEAGSGAATHQQATDDEVIAFVASERGAVGYVSLQASSGDGAVRFDRVLRRIAVDLLKARGPGRASAAQR